jgi:hypothetical protein
VQFIRNQNIPAYPGAFGSQAGFAGEGVSSMPGDARPTTSANIGMSYQSDDTMRFSNQG